MKIRRLETFANRFVAFVRVTADDGSEGWGQLSTYQSDITALVFHRQVAPYVLGADISTIDAPSLMAMGNRVFEKEHKFPGSYLKRAVGGLDTALWDLAGKRAGQPVCALLGGTPGTLRAYASSMRRDITPEQEAERFRKLRGQFGFDAFKFRVGAEYGHDVDEWPGRTEAIVPAIRKALGSEVSLLVDGNSAFSPKRAIEVGRLLEAEGIEHFEEPCLYWELDQTKEVTDALDVAVTGGEQDCELPVWRQMAERHVVDVLQPDVLYLGGIARTLAVCELGRKHGLPITPHAANWGLVTLFTMHLLRAIPNAGKYLEFSIEGPDYYPWQYGLYRSWPYDVEGGRVTVGDAPGWGIEIDPEWLAKSAYQVSELS